MRWHDLAFFHWRIDAALLRPLVPAGLEIDCHDGSAWVGLVPFGMDRVRVRGLPPIPTTHAFAECNVRTYVSRDGIAGVWFFSLDAASWLAVKLARAFFHLNYLHARMSLRRSGDRIDYAVARHHQREATLSCAWQAGAAVTGRRPGDLLTFLTERYVLFAADGGGRLYRGSVWHHPWALRHAEVIALDDRLVAAAGLSVDPRSAPVVHHADSLDVEVWRVGRV
jgi:hypothetical protein